MKTLSLKSVVMLIITIIATTITETGFPEGAEWIVLSISTLGTALVHIGQSLALPTNTIAGDLNGRDLIKGGIVALGNFLAQFAASHIPAVEIDYGMMAQSAAMVFIMYILKQLATPPAKITK